MQWYIQWEGQQEYETAIAVTACRQSIWTQDINGWEKASFQGQACVCIFIITGLGKNQYM